MAKIIKDSKEPFVLKPEHSIGKRLKCKKCSCVFEIEPEDVEKITVEHQRINSSYHRMNMPCPKCFHYCHWDHPPLSKRQAVVLCTTIAGSIALIVTMLWWLWPLF